MLEHLHNVASAIETGHHLMSQAAFHFQRFGVGFALFGDHLVAGSNVLLVLEGRATDVYSDSVL